jgi:outer membrane receptor protein involved in Fe transport
MRKGFFKGLLGSVAAALLLTMTVTDLHAQIGGGSITGTVTDPTGAAVVGASVTATNVGTNAVTEVTTDQGGGYVFVLLQAGSYQLEARVEGFQRATTALFDLNAGTRPRFDLVLVVGAIVEEVQVIAAAPLVNTTTTDVGIVISERRLEGVPLNGRNWQQVVGFQNGAIAAPSTSTGGRGGLEFNGASAFSNNLLMDGVDMTFGENQAAANDQAGGAGTRGARINTISIEAVQEFKTTGGAFSAEYGRATGGVINITTKSGTNDFHGTLFEFFRNEALDANEYFSNRAGLAKPPSRFNQYGANIGGPLARDKAFFFFNYEGATTRIGTPIVDSKVASQLLRDKVQAGITAGTLDPEMLHTISKEPLPTEANLSKPDIGLHRRNGVRKTDENTFVTRADFNAGSHRLTTRFNLNHQNLIIPVITPEHPRSFPNRFKNFVFQDNWSASPTVFNELRVGYNHVNLNRTTVGGQGLPDGTIDSNGASPLLFGLTVDSSRGPSVGYLSRIHYITSTYTVADNITMVKGRHTIKAGFEIREVNSSRLQLSTKTRSYYTNIDNMIADVPRRYSLVFIGPKALQNGNRGLFLQDDWRVTNNFQFNIGVRYEYTPPIRGAFNVLGNDPFGNFRAKGDQMWESDRNNFGPRLGMVWDVNGDQRLVMRVGAGISYMPSTFMHFFDMSFENPELPYFTSINTPELPTDLCDAACAAFPLDIDLIMAPIRADPTRVEEIFGSLGRNIINANNDDEYAGMWNVSLQYAATDDLALEASYVATKSINNWSTRWVNRSTYSVAEAKKIRAAPEERDIRWSENDGRNSYHAMQIKANQKFGNGLGLDFYFTWARTMSYYTTDTTHNSNKDVQNAFGTPQNNWEGCIACSYGPKGSDIRKNMVMVYSYALPTGDLDSRFARTLLGGWELQGIMNWRSGLPINVLAGKDLVQRSTTRATRPDLVGGKEHTTGNTITEATSGLRWLNTNAFSNTAALAEMRFGNLGWNALRGPSGFSWDMGLHKTFNLTEAQRVTFRVELFNALNHPVFANPQRTFTSSQFGQIQGTQGVSPSRNIQFGLKYFF